MKSCVKWITIQCTHLLSLTSWKTCNHKLNWAHMWFPMHEHHEKCLNTKQPTKEWTVIEHHLLFEPKDCGCIQRLRNAVFWGYILKKEGIKARPNLMSDSLPVSWDALIWSIFEGGIDVSFTACSVTVELKNKDGVRKLFCWPFVFLTNLSHFWYYYIYYF